VLHRPRECEGWWIGFRSRNQAQALCDACWADLLGSGLVCRLQSDSDKVHARPRAYSHGVAVVNVKPETSTVRAYSEADGPMTDTCSSACFEFAGRTVCEALWASTQEHKRAHTKPQNGQ
jgi:hypothetical protein